MDKPISFSTLKKNHYIKQTVTIPRTYRTYDFTVRCHTDLAEEDANVLDDLRDSTSPGIVIVGIGDRDAIDVIQRSFEAFCIAVQDYLPASTFSIDSWGAELNLRRYADEHTDADDAATSIAIVGGGTAAFGGALYGVGAVVPQTRPPGGGGDNTLIVYSDTKHDLKQAGIVFAAIGGAVAVPALGYKLYKWGSRKLKDRQVNNKKKEA